MPEQRRKLFRLIVPAYPAFNIYTRFARMTTALGAVIIATVANKLLGWEVEIIDENNCDDRTWPAKAEDGLIDHVALQAIRPADVVGFYASMSSTIPRVYKLARIYHALGVFTIAGGYHARALPQDMLDNGIDLVAMDGGEQTMIDALTSYEKYLKQCDDQEAGKIAMVGEIDWSSVSDAAFMVDGKMIVTAPKVRTEKCLPWPLPDFGLLRYGKMDTYPINWRHGCPYRCEFCAVKEQPDFIPAEEFMAKIEYLVEKFGAKKFFIVDDHFGGNLHRQRDYDETMKLLGLLADYQKRIGKRLSFTIQIRLNMSKKTELLVAMRKASIDNVCIGYESPIDAELEAMRKGYSSANMIKWTKLWRKAGFFVHGMFIFAYPEEKTLMDDTSRPHLTIKQRAAIYRRFIKKAKIDTAQVLLAVPLPGTELRDRLMREGRLLPGLGWEYYDGQFPLYDPIDATPEELQDAMHGIMGKFYSPRNLMKLPVNWCFHFPCVVFPSVVTLLAFRTRYIASAYQTWRNTYHRNTWIRAGGWFVVKHWDKQFKTSGFRDKLKKAKQALAESQQQKGENQCL